MDCAFHVPGDPDALLARLCPLDHEGHVNFGWSSGRSRAPTNHKHLFERQVEFVGYVLEGFVTYKLSLERAADGLRFIVRAASDSQRDKAVDWLFREYLKSQGYTFSEHAL